MTVEYKGIDVSKHNGVVDFNKVVLQGYSFVMIRAGFGQLVSQKDPKFETNYANAVNAGLHVGAYWYSYATTPNQAALEADAFLKVIAGKKFDYPVAFDIEDSSQTKLSTETRNKIINTFMGKMREAGYYCMLYSYESFFTSYVSKACYSEYDIWCANTTRTPRIEHGMHQYSFKGRVNGISGDVDLDVTTKEYPKIIKQGGYNGYPPVNDSTNNQDHTNTQPQLLSVDEIAREVIAGKWGNGVERQNKLIAAGYNYTEVQKRVIELLESQGSTPAKKTIEQIAQECINGEWGNGNSRKAKLTLAGYDWKAVQDKVNELLAKKKLKSIDEVAREVIAGKWGNGNTRKTKLTAAGYNYTEVQKRVTELLKKK